MDDYGSDYITRQAALEALEQIRYALWGIDIPHSTVPEYIEHHRSVQDVMERVDVIRKKMEGLPGIDGQTVRRGHWEDVGKIENTWTVSKCSACGYQTIDAGNYCTSCGALMDEGVN